MNKKILGLVLLAALIITPVIAFGQSDVPGSAEQIATNISKLVLTIATMVVVVGWVIAGMLYLTAAGAPEKIKIAKGAMIAALIGTVLVVIGNLSYTAIEGIIKNVLSSGT